MGHWKLQALNELQNKNPLKSALRSIKADGESHLRSINILKIHHKNP
jgi:hypothetical protein